MQQVKVLIAVYFQTAVPVWIPEPSCCCDPGQRAQCMVVVPCTVRTVTAA